MPVIAWTVTASGGALSGQVLAPAAVRRGLFGQWRQALGLDEVTETPSAKRDGRLPARPRYPRRRRGQRHRDHTSRHGGAGDGPGRAARAPRHAPGLLASLMAAVRPEFRAGVLVFDPADPVFGGDSCRVPECGRTARAIGMCFAHHKRWTSAGRPDPVRSTCQQRRAGRGSGTRR